MAELLYWGVSVPLLGEYFFRSSEHKKAVSHHQFGSTGVAARLQKYLKTAVINDRETPHIFRVGISYTLKGLGCTPEQIAENFATRPCAQGAFAAVLSLIVVINN